MTVLDVLHIPTIRGTVLLLYVGASLQDEMTDLSVCPYPDNQ